MNQQELKSILELHRKWVMQEADGVRADLRGADLRGANLRGADLRGAHLRGANLSDANLSDANLSDANLSDANLSDADLSDANLSDANLSGANLSDIKEDYFKRMALQPNEIVGLYKALIDGKINGQVYEGECACFCGTIANIAHVTYNELPNLKPDSTSLTEKWYLAIKKGDTPENNPVSEITVVWTKEFLEVNGVTIPSRKVVWE